MARNAVPNLPCLRVQPATQQTLLIAGGGPSLKTNLDRLRREFDGGGTVVGLNEVPHFLRAEGIPTWAAMHCGPIPLTEKCVGDPISGMRYFIASICTPAVFDRLSGRDVVIWNTATGYPLLDAELRALDTPVVDGGWTVGLRAIGLGWVLGFRRFVLFGFDSSAAAQALHAYASVSDPFDIPELAVACDGDVYMTTPELVGQVQDFCEVHRRITQMGGSIEVFGEGLLPHVWRELSHGRSAPALTVPGEAGDGPLVLDAEMF